MIQHLEHGRKKARIRAKLSRIIFPETCPVCSDEAEDLVFVTVIERHGPESHESSLLIRGEDRTSAALEAAKGAMTFAVPTCMRHGSKTVRGLRTKMIAVAGFFIFFYPILFFLLQINVALIYSRSLMEPLLGLVVFSTALIIAVLYGIFPRALERALRFECISRAKDSVDVIMSNIEYMEKFLAMNEIFTENEKDKDSF
ncbi:MAG: hypothetical protein ACFFDV_03125 [Candidatus Thorarchaeota archaeon]